MELVGSDRTQEELSREFECSAQAIRNWVRQAGLGEGRRSNGLTSVEHDELRRLRRDNLQLCKEREIPRTEPRPGLAGRPAVPGNVRFREGEADRSSRGDDVLGAGGLRQRLLRVGCGAVRRRASSATARRRWCRIC